MYNSIIRTYFVIITNSQQKSASSPMEGRREGGGLAVLLQSFLPLCWLMKTVSNSAQFSTINIAARNIIYQLLYQCDGQRSKHYFGSKTKLFSWFVYWKMGGLRWVRCYYNVVGKWCWNIDKILSMTSVANDKIIFPAILGKNININLSLSSKSRRYVCS